MSLLAALLLLGAAQGAAEAAAPGRDPGQAARPAGAALSIGGTAFDPADIDQVSSARDSFTFAPLLVLTFSEAGRKKFAGVQQGRIGKTLDLALDGKRLSSFTLPEPVQGATVQIAGLTDAEVDAVVARLGRAASER